MFMTLKTPTGSRWTIGDFGGFAAKFGRGLMLLNLADWANVLSAGFFF